MNDMPRNLDKLHTTELGAKRIRQNLGLQTVDVVLWCKSAISEAEKSSALLTVRKGKNWYFYTPEAEITVNARSFTIITAHSPKTVIRRISGSDYPTLQKSVHQAVFMPREVEPPPWKK